jgi:phosphoribosylamine--glycine ligase
MLRPGVVGKDGRTTAIIRSLRESPQVSEVIELSDWKDQTSTAEARKQVIERASAEKPDFVVIGPEGPLAAGIVNDLAEIGIPAVGPTRDLAQLEASKSFTRDLLRKHDIAGNPRYRVFRSFSPDIAQWLRQLGEFVVKPDGLTGGKGVRVSGDHFRTIDEGLDYCRELLETGRPVIVEERLEGEEFSLQSLSDGKTLVHTPVVQDHKRALEGDRGPNTGGMGSYSCADHQLPFLTSEQIREAQMINERVAEAILEDVKEPYRGVLYGGFMATRDGVRLIEYNARFGDPEALNVLPLLENDFASVCQAIVQGSLDRITVKFRPLASVCKYLVPEGYPDNPVKGEAIDLFEVLQQESDHLRVYKAAIQERDGKACMTGSRAVAVVGLAPTLDAAFTIAENAASLVTGRVVFRHDIGSRSLVQRRIDHMQAVLENRSELVR